jgi:TonB family protein
MSAQRKHNTLNAFLRYLKGELSPEERHELERDLEADAFEKEAMEGFESIAAGELEEDMLSLHAKMRKRLQRRRRATLYGIAATVASILVVGTIFINIYDFNPAADKEAPETGVTLQNEEPLQTGQALQTGEAPQNQEPLQTGEALQGEKGPTERSQPAPVPESKEVETYKGPEAAEGELAAKGEADEAEADGVAAPQMARDQIPEMAEEMAEEMAAAPEGDGVMAVEAAPTRRQKRAMSQAKTVSPVAEQVQVAELLSGRVSGVVISSEDSYPLPGASVFSKDSDSGVVTDLQGRFTIPAGEGRPTTVVASFVGMLTEEYQLDPDQENRVVMQPDPSTVNEVVVMAYGAQNEKYPVSAVQKIQVNQEEFDSESKGAEPVGGIQAYKMYMEKNIRFPAGDTLSKRGVVVLTFQVNSDGSLSGIQTLRSPGEAFTEEAIRLLEEGPPWNPAQDESGTTGDVVRMRIVFKK